MARADARRGRQRRLKAPAPELRLLLACARLDPRPGDREAVERLLAGALDWPTVLGLAEWHGLRPLLLRHLDPLRDRVPRAPYVALWSEGEAIRRRNAAKARELLSILDILESAGIRAVPYKGPTLAIAAYGDLGLREFGDLDLLLPRAVVQRARSALGPSGYRPEFGLTPDSEAALVASEAQSNLVLRSSATGTLVELHWKSDATFPVERLGAPDWWRGLVPAPLLDRSVPTLPPHELLLVLCLHGGKHAWSSLGWLVDVAELLRRDPAIDWRWIRARAAELACERRLALGLRLARDLLDAPLPGEARAAIAESGLPAALPDRIAGRLCGSPRNHPASLVGVHLATLDGGRQRVRHLWRVALSPTPVERSRWPLPRGLGFLYPALRALRVGAKYIAWVTRGK